MSDFRDGVEKYSSITELPVHQEPPASPRPGRRGQASDGREGGTDRREKRTQLSRNQDTRDKEQKTKPGKPVPEILPRCRDRGETVIDEWLVQLFNGLPAKPGMIGVAPG